MAVEEVGMRVVPSLLTRKDYQGDNIQLHLIHHNNMEKQNMSEKNAIRLVEMAKKAFNMNQISLNDTKTYDLLLKGNTDGIFMMETEWALYDLQQIRPTDFEELIAFLALSSDELMNPYIYPYVKRMKMKKDYYPPHKKIAAVEAILQETHGMLLYKEQMFRIMDHLNEMTKPERKEHLTAIRIILKEIDDRRNTVTCYEYFKKRAELCFRMAYVKAHFPDMFYNLKKEILKSNV